MDLLAVENELLEDGVKYTGSVYVKNRKKIPHGYGRKNFPDYYYESRFMKLRTKSSQYGLYKLGYTHVTIIIYQ